MSSPVDLPVLPSEISISAAVDRLRKEGRSGFVTERRTGPVVLTAADLIATWQDLGDVRVSAVTPQLSTASVAADREGLVILEGRRLTRRDAIETVLSETGADFVIALAPAAKMQVVAAQETMASALSRTIVLCKCPRCKKPLTTDSLMSGSKCPYHGETVECE